MVWRTNKLGDICELIKRGIAPKYVDEGGVCVLNQKCIRDHSVNYELARRHNLAVKSVNPERYIQVGDVLVNSTGTGTLGRVAQIRSLPDEPTSVDTHVTIVRPKEGLFYNDFFGYMLIKIENEITLSGEGASGQTELARTTLEQKFDVSFPESIPEQKRIVAILDEAFAGISLAVANAEKNLANARELFESYLNNVFTQKGEGWVEKNLEDICYISSKLVDPREREHIEFPHVGAGNIVSMTGELIEVKTAREEGLVSGKFLFDNEMVLYSKIRPYLVKVCRPDFEGLCSADIYPLSVKTEKLERNFLFYILMSHNFTEYAIAGSARAGMPKVNRNHLFNYQVFIPNISKQKDISEKLDKLFIEKNQLEKIYQQKLTALNELKQSILQKVFSGQLTKEN